MPARLTVALATAQTCGYGLYAFIANNCYGFQFFGTGLYANNANNCYGQSSGGRDGLDANTANSCRGSSGGAAMGWLPPPPTIVTGPVQSTPG